VQPISSVEAFLALYLENPEQDPAAAEILSQLDAGERAVLKARPLSDASNLLIASAAVSASWPHISEKAIAHVEERALVRLRRELQKRKLLRP